MGDSYNKVDKQRKTQQDKQNTGTSLLALMPSFELLLYLKAS